MTEAITKFPVAIEEEQKRSIEETLELLTTTENGISEEEAIKRLEIYGPNEIIEGKKRGLFDIFVDQFRDVMVLILIVAMTLSLFLGESIDAVVIGIIVVLNAILGTFQNRRLFRETEMR